MSVRGGGGLNRGGGLGIETPGVNSRRPPGVKNERPPGMFQKSRGVDTDRRYEERKGKLSVII